jgi:protein SCO1/2
MRPAVRVASCLLLPTPRFARTALAALAVLAAEACTPSPKAQAGGRYSGIELKPAKPKVDFTLATTDGRPYAFAQETAGQVALLFFGYTSCPDVCPVHMANIAEALERLTPGERARIRVLFVSTDPARDTPERLRTWLAHFDSSFVGLRGPVEDVNRIEQAYGIGPSSTDQQGAADTAYAVGHAAQILAFTPDDSLRVFYPFGTRQQDWVRDLPRLLRRGRGE